jgi:hypothetical protein
VGENGGAREGKEEREEETEAEGGIEDERP